MEKRRWRRKGMPSGVIAVLLGCALVVAASWTITLERITYERSEAIGDAVREDANLALAFEEQTVRAIKSADQLLLYLKREYERDGKVVDLRELAAGGGIDDSLIPNFLVADARGHVLLPSGEAGPVNIADREFFASHRSNRDGLLRISKPFTGRVTGKTVISVSRPLLGPDRSFRGVVALGLDPNYFLESYKRFDLGRDGLVQLVGVDGIVRARRQGNETSFGDDLSGSTLLEQAAAHVAGSFESSGDRDGVRRFHSYRALKDYPMVVSVATPVDAALAQFRSNRGDYYLGASAATFFMLLFGALLAFSLQRRKLAMEAALRATRRYQATFDQAAVGVAHATCEGRLLKVNRKLCEMLGYTEAELVALAWPDVTHADDTGLAVEWVRKMVADPGLSVPELEKRYRRKDGSELVGIASLALVRDTEGRPDYVVSVLQDITGRKQAEKKVRRLNRVYAVLSQINSLIVRVRDREDLFREACRICVEQGEFRMAWIGVVDQPAEAVKPVASAGEVGDFFDSAPFASPGGKGSRRGLAWQALDEKKAMVSNDVQADARITMKNECRVRGINSLAMLPLAVGGKGAGVLALYAREAGFFDDAEMKLLLELAGDISFALEHIGKTEKLDYLADYDPLTGLANRALFHNRLEQLIGTARREAGKLGVLLLDIERFRTINETLGRAVGDDLLGQIADRAGRHFGEPGRLARVGADQFAAVIPGIADAESLQRRIEQEYREIFGVPFQLGDTALRVSARFGIALFPDDGGNAERLLRNAEAALKKAKSSGEKYQFYTVQMTERVAENLALENKLRQGLEKDEFVLHYQPKVSLRSGGIVGVEALIRWQSPELGLVPPVKFIPLLEETGLILQVGSWALRRAARDHRAWVEQGLKPPRVAVNVSAIQLRQRDFVAVVEQAIIDGVAPTGIDLEITESLIMQDVEATIAKLENVRALGIRIAIDDFGTGYSSLAYLAKLPVETLKIDRSFIIRMLENANTMTLVQTMISLAHSLDLKVVAEGVDSEEQAKVLRLLRCDQMQGYLFSKPLPLDAMTELLKAKG